VLERVGREISSLQTVVLDVERLVGRMMGERDDVNALAPYIVELQQLDALAQRIAGVGDYLNALACDLPAEWRVDAHAPARRLGLSEQANRLTGAALLTADDADLNSDPLFAA
jgi:hypothetical protein